MFEEQSQVLSGCETLQAEDGDTVRGLDFVVVGRIDKGKSEHTLLLQIGLVDTSERADNDSQTTEEAGLEGCVFAGRALAIVVITDDDPLDALFSVFGGDLRNTSPFTSDLVLDFVCLTVLRIDSTNETIFFDWVSRYSKSSQNESTHEKCSQDVHGILTTGHRPRCGQLLTGNVNSEKTFDRRNLLTALALDLDKDGEIGGGITVPRLEGLEELKAVTLGVNCYLNADTISRRSLEGVLARVVATRGKFIARGVGEFEGLAVSSGKCVSERVEGQATSKGHSGDDIRGSNKGVGGGVGVVTTGEITVVGSDD